MRNLNNSKDNINIDFQKLIKNQYLPLDIKILEVSRTIKKKRLIISRNYGNYKQLIEKIILERI